MGLRRAARHLAANRWRVRRAFPPHTLDAIEAAIRASETQHSGQIRFAVEGALEGLPLLQNQPARERAIDLFAQLRVWDTEQNNGVLIYVLLADRDVEIVADRGIAARVGQHEWDAICAAMEQAFRRGDFERGVLEGIARTTQLLARHFPKTGGRNELPDAPVVV